MTTWAAMAAAWQHDAALRSRFTRALADAPHRAFAWETVPVSAATRERTYEEVVIDSPALARVRADPSPFQAHIRGTGGVVSFANLGGDARLIVPEPGPGGEPYPHLAAFVRTAPAAQIDQLWIEVGRAVEEHWRQSDAPVWVSTAGLGVHWLHVRLDARPKYYRHAPFRDHSGSRA